MQDDVRRALVRYMTYRVSDPPSPKRPPRIYEDDPRWNPKTMGNHKGRKVKQQHPRPAPSAVPAWMHELHPQRTN